MRVREGRSDVCPATRIAGLRRYAFIGDSFTYGQGVPPDATLPAQVERRMNELMPGDAVEAVNLGVCGYNLWNNWLSFKALPQVYDGVVLVLCSNDADLFGRSYKLAYAEPRDVLWEATHPFGQAVAACFNDIAAYSKAFSLPVAVCFYNFWNYPPALRTAEILRGLCVARDLLFIDSCAHLNDRNFPNEDLQVSEADAHPSAKVHDAVGRYVADVLRRQGWFGQQDAKRLRLAPACINDAVGAMILEDHYPPDAAMHWGLRAMEAKLRVARRLQVNGSDALPAVQAESAALSDRTHRWHVANRVRAFMADVACGAFSLTSALWSGQEFRVQLAELGYALEAGRIPALAAALEMMKSQKPAPQESVDASALRNVFGLDDARIMVALGRLRDLVPEDDVSACNLFLLVARVRAECAALRADFAAFEDAFAIARGALSQDETAMISGLIAGGLAHLIRLFHFLPRWPGLIEQFCETEASSYTKIDVTVRADSVGGTASYWLTAQAEYNTPNRLWFSDNGNFQADGTDWRVRLYVPVMYIGRISLRPWFRSGSDQVMEARLVKVEIYNRPSQRRVIPLESFRRDSFGQYVSSQICLT
jgi:hypothetical protein